MTPSVSEQLNLIGRLVHITVEFILIHLLLLPVATWRHLLSNQKMMTSQNLVTWLHVSTGYMSAHLFFSSFSSQ